MEVVTDDDDKSDIEYLKESTDSDDETENSDKEKKTETESDSNEMEEADYEENESEDKIIDEPNTSNSSGRKAKKNLIYKTVPTCAKSISKEYQVQFLVTIS